MSKHTSTPFEAHFQSRITPQGWSIVAQPDAKEIAIVPDDKRLRADNGEPTIGQANAEFIVLACNCHDELLAALKHLEMVDSGPASETTRFLAREQARAAIAAAEGTQP